MEIKVQPASKDIKVRKPDGAHLSDEGETVTRNAFWIRRIADGDGVEITQPVTAAKKGA
jgi:ribosomal protein L19